jgi:hypothetical protein
MRGSTKIALATVFGLMSVGLVVGQPGGGFGGGGFGGGFGGSDAFSLLKRKDIQKELKLTEEQIEKLNAAVEKAARGVLEEKQAARLNQIQLQQKGVNAFKDPEVQEKLKLTKVQKDDISALLSDFQKDSEKIQKDEGFKGFKKIAELRKELTERVQGVLNASQKTSWEDMIGEKFKSDFGGKPGGKPGTKPKSDTQ